jgi:hypothetical protein
MGSINVLHVMHRHNKSTKMSQTTPLLEPIAWTWYTLPNLNLHLIHVFYIKLVHEMRPNIKLDIKKIEIKNICYCPN